MKERLSALLFLALAAMLSLSSCTKDGIGAYGKKRINVKVSASGTVTKSESSINRTFNDPYCFSASSGSSFEISMAESLNESLPFAEEECTTKAEVVTTSNITKVVESFTLNIYPESCTDFSSPTMTSPVSFSGKAWKLTEELFWPDEKEGEDERLNFWAYVYPSSDSSYGTISHSQSKETMSISFDGPASGNDMNDAALLKDLLYAYTPYSDVKKGDKVPIQFHHAMAAIQFELGTLSTGIDITGITVNNVIKDGNCVFTPGSSDMFVWSRTTSPKKANYGQSFNISGAGSSKYDKLDKSANSSLTLFIVPQDLGNDVSLTVHFKNASDNTEHSVSAKLKGIGFADTWKAGHVYTYMISGGAETIDVTVDDEIIGGVKQNLAIKNTGNVDEFVRAAIVAAWYDASGNIVAAWSESDGSFENLCPSGWTKGDDGFYYTTSAIQPGNETPKLFSKYTKPSTAPVTGAHLEMEIIVQAVKAIKGKSWDQVSW